MKLGEFELNKIYYMDAIEFLKKIPDNSVDLVLTDPPYNISKKNNFGTMERYSQYEGMDFGEWDKEFNLISWIKIATQKMKSPSSIIIFSSWQNLKIIADELEKRDISVKRVLVLKKTNPMPVNRDRLFVNSFEFMIWGTKGTKWTFNRRGVYETGFFECKNNGITKHPTEKQVKTIKELLEILTNENDIVLDPFLGSGTTAVACKQLGRNFIGCDISEEYVKIANKRLEQEVL